MHRHHTHRTIAGHPLGLILLLMLAMMVGCASGTKTPAYHPVFPSPPAEARLIHRADVRTIRDVASPGWFKDFVDRVTGSDTTTIARPTAIAHDDGRHLYIADLTRQAVHVFDTRRGRARLIRRAGDRHLVSPVGLAVLSDGRLAVADSALGEVFIFDASDRLVGSLKDAKRPTGLHLAAASNELYVVDTLGHEVLVYDARLQLSRRIGERGSGPGQLNHPTQVCVDREGRIHVTDSMNFRVQVFDPAGRYLTHIGQQGNATGYLAVPKGVAVDSHGHIYVADSYFSTVQVYDREGRFLLAFGGPGERSGEFHLPIGMTMDSEDRLYVADSFNSRVQIFQYIGGPSHESE